MGADRRLQSRGASGRLDPRFRDHRDRRRRLAGRGGRPLRSDGADPWNIERALGALGARIEDVVRTRIYVTDISRWEEVGRAHGEVFGAIRPATAMVEVRRLIDPRMLVEIEAVAIVG